MELRPTIDRAWLERAAAQDPFLHAYGLWDLDHAPNRVRFVAAMDGEQTVGYLLVWLGHPTQTVVHWVGADPRARILAEALPSRPLIVIVPEVFQNLVVASRGPARPFTLLLLAKDPTSAVRPDPHAPSLSAVRRLERPDLATLAAFALRSSDPVVAEYPTLDPGEEWIWGAFEQGILVGVIRAAVRLPDVWLVGGVYVDPAARNHGVGRALVEAALLSARTAHVRVGLYVREDRIPARRLYERMGFRPLGRRTWLDLGAGAAP